MGRESFIQARNPIEATMTFLRATAIAFNIIFVVLIGGGQFSSSQIGAVTWGPTHDIWSMAIAISNIEHGLKGGLGYRAIAQKLENDLIDDTNDLRTRARLRQPETITRAIAAAASIKREHLNPEPIEEGGYVTSWAEDIGYAEFYNIAFRLFGYSADSTHKLYVLILALTSALFLAAFWRNNVAIALITFANAALFLTTTSAIFTDLMPSIAANRFLSTLATIPLLHIIFATIDLRPISASAKGLTVLQVIFLLFAIRARASAIWCILAYDCIVIALMFLRPPFYGRFVLRWWRPYWRLMLYRAKAIFADSFFKGSVKLAFGIWTMPRIFLVPLIVVAGLFIQNVTTRMQLDPVYFTDDVLPHHYIWQPAFVSLPMHPMWPSRKPYSELPADPGDEVANVYYLITMKRAGLSTGSPVNHGLTKSRMLDRVVRNGLISFAIQNPLYMVQLIGYYKVRNELKDIFQLVRSIPAPAVLLALSVSAIGAALLSAGSPGFRRRDIAIALFSIGVCAMLPPLWGYSAPHTVADQLWAVLFLSMALMCGLIAWSVVRRTARN